MMMPRHGERLAPLFLIIGYIDMGGFVGCGYCASHIWRAYMRILLDICS